MTGIWTVTTRPDLAEKIRLERESQGLPRVVEHAPTLGKVAAIIRPCDGDYPVLDEAG